MSYETPFVRNNPSGQSLWQATDNPRHAVGTIGVLDDGRAFKYACNRGSAISAGHILQGSSISVDFDDLATNTASVGNTTVNVTPVGTATYALNELEGGFLSINSGASGNEGRQYRISGNPATTAATAFDLTVEAIREEAFVAATTGTVCPNPWSSVALADVSTAIFVAGATTFDVPDGSVNPQYFWAQTWGEATIRADTAGDVIGHAIRKGSTADGSYIGFVDAAADVLQLIGVNLFTSVSGDFMPVYLQIAR